MTTVTTATPVAPPVTAYANGAIYQPGGAQRPLFEDRRARRVGDTLVVNINEKVTASKTAASTISKSGSVDAAVPTFSGLPGRSLLGRLGVSAESDNSFAGKGASDANNLFTGTVAVTVVEVLANGNLRIAGEKRMGINQGSEFIRLSGIINPDAVVGNAVSSTQIADARLEYRGEGAMAEAQRMGWLSRLFLSLLPF